MNKGFGYKNIQSIIENFIINFRKANEYCDKYISQIKSKQGFAKSKTLFNLLISLYLFLYSFLRLKNIEQLCKTGIMFYLILYIGQTIVIVLTSMAMKEYNVKELKYFGNCFITEEQNIIIEDESFKEEESNSNYMKKLDIAIICLNAASGVVMISLGCILSSRDSNADD